MHGQSFPKLEPAGRQISRPSPPLPPRGRRFPLFILCNGGTPMLFLLALSVFCSTSSSLQGPVDSEPRPALVDNVCSAPPLLCLTVCLYYCNRRSQLSLLFGRGQGNCVRSHAHSVLRSPRLCLEQTTAGSSLRIPRGRYLDHLGSSVLPNPTGAKLGCTLLSARYVCYDSSSECTCVSVFALSSAC
jgi:hypothetical protein